MPETTEVRKKTIEVSGQEFECHVRENDHGIVAFTEYSLDGGSHWFTTILSAYQDADQRGALIHPTPDSPVDDFHAWMIALVMEIQSLEDGDELRISRGGGAFTVSRQEVVLATRASTVCDMKLNLTEAKEDSGDEG